MQNSQDALLSSPSPSLLCQESHPVLVNDGIDDYLSTGLDDDDDDEDEYVEMLLDKEVNNSNGFQKQEFGNWIKEARLDAIQYILNTSVSFGFKIETTFLAVTYLDRFLSRRLIEDEKYWAIRLLAMACLSLAAKMEECKVPLLSEFPGEDYNFESKVIRRMEFLVLDTLDWRMAMATPFTFTYYFASKLCEINPIRDTISRVIQIISAAIRNVNVMYYTPSAIAAAATLMLLDQKLTRESLVVKINTLSSADLLKMDDIISFYNQMKELDTEKFKLSNCILSPVLSPAQLRSSNDTLGNFSVTTSGVSAKRKSLTFTDESDQNITMPDSKRYC